jgi:hypothetical protein
VSKVRFDTGGKCYFTNMRIFKISTFYDGYTLDGRCL